MCVCDSVCLWEKFPGRGQNFGITLESGNKNICAHLPANKLLKLVAYPLPFRGVLERSEIIAQNYTMIFIKAPRKA